MKHILVTGGCGFLGHHLVEHLLKNTDWHVTVLDSLSYASKGFDRLRDIDCFDNKRVDRYVWDLSRPMTSGLKDELGEFEYIAHCAAETHVDNSIADPLSFVQSNVVATANLLQYAREQDKLEMMVYFSTDEVFGPAHFRDDFKGYGDAHDAYNCHPKVSYREWDRYNSTNPYSATKAGAEELCLAWANTYGVPIVITHCMNLFGERQHVEKFIPGTIARLLRDKPIIIHGDSTKQRAGSRTYLHARNAGDAVLFLLAHGRRREKYNIAGLAERSNLELAQYVAWVVGKNLCYEMVDFHSSRPGHDLRYALDGTKLADMGWKAPVEFEESLDKTIKWFLTHKEWLGIEQG